MTGIGDKVALLAKDADECERRKKGMDRGKGANQRRRRGRQLLRKSRMRERRLSKRVVRVGAVNR